MRALFSCQLPENRAVSQIFISYRRQDAAAEAMRLQEHLAARFGRESVFLDVASLAPGRDFADAMRRAVESCKVMLVVMGPRWAMATGPDGRRRLDDPQDFIRVEVAAALRLNRPVVPVLVGGAPLPTAEMLPQDLRALTQFHAVSMGVGDWGADVDRLAGTLERQLGVRSPVLPGQAMPPGATVPSAPARGGSFLSRLGRAWQVLVGDRDEAPPATPAAMTPAVSRAVRPLADRRSEPAAVFISYSSKDRAFVDRLVPVLEAQGRRCWIAHRDIPAGVVAWSVPIVTAIASSRLAVILLSERSMGSDEVLREVTLAADEKIPMLPVTLDATPLATGLRYFFTAGQRLDLAGLAATDQVARIVPSVLERCPIDR
jgi:TIR domain